MTPTERDDINKRIAEDLGWTVPLTPGLKCQRCKYLFSDMQHGCPECSDKYPPNFFTDPACTLMLLEKMIHEPSDIYEFYIDGAIIGGDLTEKGARIHSAGFFIDIEKDKLGEAVALAYVRMRNLK